LARVLIVGCGCRGRQLAEALVAEGHAVRGTSRSAQSLPEIEAAGAEAAVADPGRLGTLLPLLEGVSAVCWLMGTADEGPLHGPRLRSLQEKLVDSPARGLIYEAGGTAKRDLLAGGAEIVGEVGETFRMPVAIVDEDPADVDAWTAAMLRGVGEVLGA
jgi:NAD(P)-dependent dehydrogenase (short-subunit alcohol dehydrogenase family)